MSIHDEIMDAAARPAHESVHSVTVTYRRGELSASVTAFRENHGSRNEGRDAEVMQHLTAWSLKVSELLLDGRQQEPERGDTITTSAGEVYQVMPVDGEAWEWTGTDHAYYRVFTTRRQRS